MSLENQAGSMSYALKGLALCGGLGCYVMIGVNEWSMDHVNSELLVTWPWHPLSEPAKSAVELATHNELAITKYAISFVASQADKLFIAQSRSLLALQMP